MPDTVAGGLRRAPLSEIIFILLQHFRVSLTEAGLNLAADETREMAQAIAAGQRQVKADSVAQHIANLVDSQLAELESRWQIDFPTSLRADMGAIGPWRTTAEFLALANDKAEAETDIALGSALLVAAGRRVYALNLLAVLEHDAGEFDIDATIARRILLRVSGVDGARSDWLAQVRRWLDNQPPRDSSA